MRERSTSSDVKGRPMTAAASLLLPYKRRDPHCQPPFAQEKLDPRSIVASFRDTERIVVIAEQ
jgi:hypothetical protein